MVFKGTVNPDSLLVYLFPGYGGGYNERDGVEYIERQDSDDEFDEVKVQ